jgi:hypothetical protein
MMEKCAHKKGEHSISFSSGSAAIADSNYRFTLWVCDVAEAVARAKSFSYRGVDLSYAFERGVYFALINNPEAYEVFRAERLGKPAALPAGEPTPAREILAEYLAHRDPARPPNLPLRERLLNFARRTAAALMRRKPSGPLWALAIQPRFVAHLKPILDELGAPYRLVTFDDPVTDEYARALGYLSLNAGAGNQTVPLRRLPNDIDLVRSHALAFDAAFQLMFEELPSGILLSEGNAPIYEIVNLAARKLRIPTVCVQQGWSPIVHTGFRNLRFSSMIVWGDWFAKALAPHNPAQRFSALGNHLIALGAPKALRPKTVGFFLQRGSRLISDDAWAGMLDLIEFCARELPRARVIVREHPNGPLTEDERARLSALPAVTLMPPAQVPLQPVLVQCDVVVSIFSTTILEGIGAGALPLVVNVASLPSYYPNVAAEGAGIEVRDFAMAREALSTLWAEGTARYAPRVADLQRRLFASGGSDAIGRIVAHLRTTFRLAADDRAQL